jgi:hypothetical protein
MEHSTVRTQAVQPVSCMSFTQNLRVLESGLQQLGGRAHAWIETMSVDFHMVTTNFGFIVNWSWCCPEKLPPCHGMDTTQVAVLLSRMSGEIVEL